jgi:hypothetical protein
MFEQSQAVRVSIIRRHGIEPEVLVSRIATRMRDNELREERPVNACARHGAKVDEIALLKARVHESAGRVVEFAIEEAWRRGHPSMREDHWIIAFARAESALFHSALEHGQLNPVEVLFDVQLRLTDVERSGDGGDLVSRDVDAMLERADEFARQRGAARPDAEDLLFALITSTGGPFVYAAPRILSAHRHRRGLLAGFARELRSALPKEIASQLVKGAVALLGAIATCLWWFVS